MRSIIIAILAALIAFGSLSIVFYNGTYHPKDSAHNFDSVVLAENSETFQDSFAQSNESKGIVLIDRSHNNSFNDEDISVLAARILARGASFEVVDSDFAMSIKEAKALIVISPDIEFSKEEIKAIRNFSGKIVLISEPERRGRINSIAVPLGMVFEDSYLYNLKENDGNFMNVYISEFTKSNLTRGLSKIAVYRSCPILAQGSELAFSDRNTVSSSSESKEKRSPIALKKSVLGLCDLTLLKEPYNSFADNNKLISNIADWITG